MADILRNTDPLCEILRDTRNKAKKAAGPSSRVTGTATLVAGTVTVSSLVLMPGAFITLSRKTPGGTVGDLSAPSANRTAGNGTGSFVINAAVNTDTSTVDYTIENPWPHLDASELVLSAAMSSSLATAITLTNALHALLAFHLADAGEGLAHLVADTTNALPADFLPDTAVLATVNTRANLIKAKYVAHRTQSGVHHNNDSLTASAISSADATDQTSLNTLLNEMRTDIPVHIGLRPTNAAPSIRLVSA